MTDQVDQNPPLDQKQRVLKAIVIILGILILICIAIIVVTIVNRTFNTDNADQASTPTTQVPMEQMIIPSPGPEFGELSITMPPGSRVVSTHVTPYEIHALMVTPFGQRLVVIDRTTGEALGTVRFTAEQRPPVAQ